MMFKDGWLDLVTSRSPKKPQEASNISEKNLGKQSFKKKNQMSFNLDDLNCSDGFVTRS
jgi:hypothetical protein